jgi:ornithine carbamoyltransferase
MKEASQKDFSEISFAYLGDARNNMGNSLLVTAALLGSSVNIVAPEQLQPNQEIQQIARELAKTSKAKIQITSDISSGVKNVDFIHTDVWVSMGEAKSVWKERINLLNAYRIDNNILEMSNNPDIKFMHCLPAFHDSNTSLGKEIADEFDLIGLEVTDEVFESSASIVFDQAENRMHTMKALLVSLLENK